MRTRMWLMMMFTAAMLLASSMAIHTVAADRSVEVTASDFSYAPAHIDALPGEKLTVNLANSGRAPHDINFILEDGRREQTAVIRGGERITLTFNTPTVLGRYIYYCAVGNHRERGMEGELVIAETIPTAAPATETPTEGATPTDDPSPIPDATPATPSATATPVAALLYLPRVVLNWPPVPAKPNLLAINNADQDNGYVVQWTAADRAEIYVLSEANDPSMTGARVVYEGPATAWAVPAPGKTPATWYYTIKARNTWGEGGASGVQAVTIFPLFVGMRQRYDGISQIRGSESLDYGWHVERTVSSLADADTVNIHSSVRYDPNPLAFDSEANDFQYVLSTSRYKPSPSDPPDNGTVKWGYSWIAPIAAQFANGQTMHIDGQPFSTSGPHTQVDFGRRIQYWQLVNQTDILAWHDGDWKSYVRAGQAILWYDVANSRFLVRDDVTFTYHHKDRPSGDTGRDIGNTTSANVFPPALLTGSTDRRSMGAVAPAVLAGQRDLPSMVPGRADRFHPTARERSIDGGAMR